MMNYEDHVDMVNGVIRDIAAWHITKNGDYADEGAIDDWIYEMNLVGTRESFMQICKEYWDQYLGVDITVH